MKTPLRFVLGLMLAVFPLAGAKVEGQPASYGKLATAAKAPKQFTPGEVWLDTAGRPINAHGGGMLLYRKTYYWYGENKEGRSWMPEVNRKWDGYRVDVTGIRCYSSGNLYDWKDEGLVLQAEPGEPASDLHPSKVVERPKVAFNPKTRQFVMWMHIDTLDYQSARAGVAVASSPKGPFRYLGSVKPEGADSRDQTLFVDDDGKAYRIYSSEWNKATYISLLTDDWLRHSGKYVKIFAGKSLEGQALFKRAGKYYLFASECSGWDPNPAHAAMADSIWGPWKELGDPCLGPDAETTFHAQSTYVFPIAGKKEAFVFMADRWNKRDLPDSRYVWLPVQFNEDGPKLTWTNSWDLSSFDRRPERTPRHPGRTSASLGNSSPTFTIQRRNGNDWLVRPDGREFFSLGVCCVNMGTPPGQLNATNPSYSAWQHCSTSNQWAWATLERLHSWGFTTVGAWSDFQALKRCPNRDVAFLPVLHIGSTAGAPWWNMWDHKVTDRMEQVARDQILALRDDPRVLGYYSDNEMGWWNSALLRLTLEQAPDSEQRRRWLTVLRETYSEDWQALLKDFDPEGADNWQTLERAGRLYLRPGGNGLQTVDRFVALVADRYYALVHDIIRKYDPRALVLGDRYQSFFFPEVARACSRYVDAASSNLNAAWNDGTFPRFYLDTLHALTAKPILVSEFYMTAAQNRSGNRNRSATFPVTTTQRDRAAGAARTLHGLLKLPYIIGADWFQYYDEPPSGRFDGEDYDFGLVDIEDRPYRPLIGATSGVNLIACKQRALRAQADEPRVMPPAPAEPLAHFATGLALKDWDRDRGWVAPTSSCPMADLYLCWTSKALYIGLFAQDVVETDWYRGGKVPERDRAEWTISLPGLPEAIQCRIGAGLEPRVNLPSVRIVNSSGVNLNVRNICAIELPAETFGRKRFKAGEAIQFSSAFVAHARAYRTEWSGQFTLGSNPGKAVAGPG